MNCQGSYCYWLWTWHCDPWRQSLLLCHFIDLDTRRFNQQMHSLCTLNRTKKSNKQSLHSFLPGTVCGLPTWPLQLLSQIHWWDLPLIWKLFHVIHPNSFIYRNIIFSYYQNLFLCISFFSSNSQHFPDGKYRLLNNKWHIKLIGILMHLGIISLIQKGLLLWN